MKKEYEEEYEDQDMMDDDMSFPPDDYEPAPVEEKNLQRKARA